MSAAIDSSEETPGQRAARLRREKRAAKAVAEDRLAKIKQLNGGTAPPEDVLGGPATQPIAAADPDEVDISTHSYTGPQPADFPGFGGADNDRFQAMMQMQMEQARQQHTAGPPGAGSSQHEDPMAKMMQQLLGMAGGDPNDPNNIHNTQDPMQMLSALMGNKPGQTPQNTPQPSSRSAYLWKITHAIFALIIAGYIAATSTFDGSLLSRTQSTFSDGSNDGLGSRVFLIFITAELGLQSARFFLEGGQLQGGGTLAMVSNMAPEPYATYVRTVGRWTSILGSVISDAMVIVFVLGVMAWWNGYSSVS